MCYDGHKTWAAQVAANIPKQQSNADPSHPTDYK